jgi:hypothetical protein
MKKAKFGLLTITLMLSISLAISVSTALASDYVINEFISMKDGESQQREFEISDCISIPAFEPVEVFIILATGNAGDLNITLSADPEMDFGVTMEFGLTGFGFSLDEGFIFIMEDATTPYDIDTSVTINSNFGFVCVGAYMKEFSDSRNHYELPVPFEITFALSEAEEESEE